MKACIASAGDKPPNIHDLVKLYKVVDKQGFHLDARLQAMIVHLNHHYYKDLGTGSKFKLRYPTETSERKGGAIPNHSDVVAVSNNLLEQAANRAPDILNEMFQSIPEYRTNLGKIA